MHPHASRKLRFFLSLFFVVVAFFALAKGQVSAAINPMIRFEGKVTNLDGTELADGVYDFNFRIYNSPANGTALWSENQNAANMFSGTISGITTTASSTVYDYSGGTGTSTFAVGQHLYNASTSEAVLIIDFDADANTVTVASGSPSWAIGAGINNRPYVEGGVIDVGLGAVSDMTTIDFDQVLYLEVTFNGETMQPRKPLTALPYAFEASSLGGHSADEFASLIDNETVTGEWSFDNILNIATTSSNTALTVTQNGSGSIVEFRGGGSTYLSVLNDGRVQIGDYIFPADRTGAAAGYVLKTDLAGNLYWDVDFAGSGGGSGLWASSSNDLFIYQADPGQIISIYNNTTSTIDAFKALPLQVFGNSLFQQINIQDQEQIRFYDADSSNYMALQASSSMASDLTLTLPDNVGALGQALLTDGSGNLYWGAPTGGPVYANAGLAGQIAYYDSDGSTVSGTSSIFLSDSGYFGVGTSSPNQLFTVGVIDGSQFEINSSGQVVDGDWLAGIIGAQYGGTGTSTDNWTGIPYIDGGVWSPTTTVSVQYGGTGISSYVRGDIIYGSSTNILATLPVGSESDVLRIVNGIPEWVTASSSGIGTDVYVSVDADGAPGYIGDTAGGGVLRTNQPISYIDGGDYITLGITRNSIDEDQLLYDMDQDVTSTSSPTFDTLTLSNLNLSAFGTGLVTVTADTFGTTSNNTANWDLAYTITQASSTYWDYAYDTVFASSSFWDTAYLWGDHADAGYYSTTTTLEPEWGGTGLTSYNIGDLLIGTSSNNLERLAAGSESDVLRIVNGVPEWVNASSSGIGTDVYVAVDGTAAPGYIGDSAAGGVLRTDQPISYTDGGDYVTLGITRNSIDEDQLLYDMDQDVTSTSSPTFNDLTLSGLTLSAFGSGLVTVTADTVGTTADNTSNWDLAYTITQASSTYWDYAYDMLVASGSLYDYAYDTVFASSSFWDTAYLWGNHADAGYYSTTTTLEPEWGGTGLTSYNLGDLLIGTTSNNLTTLGIGGEGEILRIVGGEISWNSPSAVGTDEQVAIDGFASAGYIGATASDGVIRADAPLSYIDGGAFITLGITRNSIGEDQLLWDMDQHLTTTSTPTFSGLILTNALGIAYGGTGGNTATTARQSLGIQDVYEYGIDSTATSGWIWISDGVNRGHWVPSTTLSEAVSGAGGTDASVFIGTTSVEYDGAFASGTLAGYAAANSICDADYPGSHFCRVYDILVSVELGQSTGWGGRAWVAEGPPGYTSNSNDCVGWTTNDSGSLGAWWNFNPDGGAGYLIFCDFTRPLACCSRN